MREALRFWNMTVQYWLVVNVYKRFPLKPLRTVAVMVVSSMWHGVYSGYYLSLGSVPFVLVVEDLYEKIMRRKLGEQVRNTILLGERFDISNLSCLTCVGNMSKMIASFVRALYLRALLQYMY